MSKQEKQQENMNRKLRVNVHVTPSEILNTERNISVDVTDDTSWSDVCALIKEKLSIAVTEALAFQYLDDESDYISGCSEEEWKDAVTIGSIKSRDELVLQINALPAKNVGTKIKSPSNSACCSGNTPSSAFSCCFVRPIPNEPVYNGVIPEKIVNPQSSTYQYSNEALRAVTLPLGPIGGGCIALAGDGGLRQWQVVNRVCHTAHVPDSFFAIKVENDSVTSQAVLQSNTWYDESKFTPAAYITDHVVPPASKTLLQELPGVKTIEVTAKYPIAEVDVLSTEVPVHVHLEAFNPCIPLNSKDSAIPNIFFNYTVHNTNPKPVKVTMLSSLMNFVGWDGKTTITADNAPGFMGGNQNLLHTYGGNIDTGNVPEYEGLSGYYGIYMNNPSMTDKMISNGELSIGVLTKPGDTNACHLQFTDVKEMWKYFTSTEGLPGQGDIGTSEKGKSWCGALSSMREIQPNSSETFTFILSWHFPYRFSNWPQRVHTNPKSLYYLGNQYSKFWKNTAEVLTYTTQNLGRLTQLTRVFRDVMFNSTLPWQLIDSAAGRLSVLRSPTFMWLEDSNLYCFEGCSVDSGCCPLNCTHVLNYEMAVAKCFPDLERTMRDVDLLHNISPNNIMLRFARNFYISNCKSAGCLSINPAISYPEPTTFGKETRRIWHKPLYILSNILGVPVSFRRTSLPLELEAQWEDWNWTTPDSPVNLASTTICLDGDLGTVLKTYREVRQGAPADFLNKVWPRIKLMMNRYMTKLDNGNGVIPGPQPCTYDRATFGVNTFIGCLYLCALRAAEEMAKLLKDESSATIYRERFTKGSAYLDKVCFKNGQWFTQVVPQEHSEETLSDGTFVDALIGQWWAHSLGLGYLLPKDHIQSNLTYVFERNYVESFDPAAQKPRKFFDQRDSGMFITSWKNEKTPKSPLLYSFEGAWSGLMHSFAGLCFYENLNDIGLKVVTDTRNQYDGTRRSPWNEIECGDHYARAMAAFLYFEIIAGMTWEIVAVGKPALNLNFAPTLTPKEFKSFFIVGSGWGSYGQTISANGASVQLDVVYGLVELLQLGLALNFSAAKVTLDGKEINTTITKGDGKITLTFKDAVTVDAGHSLQIALS